MGSCIGICVIRRRGSGDGDRLPLSAKPVMPALFDPQVQLCGHCCGCFQYQHVHARQDRSANQAPGFWIVPCAELTSVHGLSSAAFVSGFCFRSVKEGWPAPFIQFH